MSVLQVGGQAQRVSFAEDTTVYNPSLVTVLIGNNVPDTPIAPGGAFVMAGGRSYWLATIDSSVQSVDLLSGLQYAIPSPGSIASSLLASGLASQIASFVAGTGGAGVPGGVPLLNSAQQIPLNPPASVTGNISLPASGSFPITQIGYQGLLSITTPNLVATTLTLVFSWFVNGLFAGSDTLIIYASATGSGNQHQIKFRGPTKGNQLVVLLFASSGSVNLVDLVMFQDSRVYEVDRWQSDQFKGTFPGFATLAQCDPDVGILISNSLSIGASTTNTYLLPFWTGRAILSANTGSNTNDMSISIFTQADAAAIGGNALLQTSDSTGDINATPIVLPRAQCEMTVTNHNVAAKTVNFMLTAAEY